MELASEYYIINDKENLQLNDSNVSEKQKKMEIKTSFLYGKSNYEVLLNRCFNIIININNGNEKTAKMNVVDKILEINNIRNAPYPKCMTV